MTGCWSIAHIVFGRADIFLIVSRSAQIGFFHVIQNEIKYLLDYKLLNYFLQV
jgi:hypothetical protein